MRLLADEIATAPAAWQRTRIYRRVSELLRRPSPNHAAGPMGYTPCVDRFVFLPSDTKLIETAGGLDLGPYDFDLWSIARPPLPTCWIEFGNWGWFIEAEEINGLAFPYAHVFCRGKKGLPPITVGRMSLPDEWQSTAAGSVDEHWPREGIEDALEYMNFLALLLVIIATPNVVSTRRVAPGQGSPAASQRALRQAQRGRPVYSFNEVRLTPGRTAIHNGVVKPSAAFVGKRGHMVIGHWRLLEKKLEPVWVWVEGHERGDPDKGRVIKQRIVANAQSVIRRGYFFPERDGYPGARMAARPAPSVSEGR